MSSEQPGGEQPPQQGEQVPPEQEEMLRQMEEEMRKVRVQDVVTQSVVSILNLSARRIAKEDERDLEQARVGIDAVRALVDLLEPEPQQEVRNALSQVQMLYAQQSGAEPAPGEAAAPGAGEAEGGPPEPGEPKGGSSRLWTPGSG
jgi:hypothetical protein